MPDLVRTYLSLSLKLLVLRKTTVRLVPGRAWRLESYLVYLSVVSLGTSPPGLVGVPLVSICKYFVR